MNYDIFVAVVIRQMSLTFQIRNFTEGEMKMSIKMFTLLQSHKDVNNNLIDVVWFYADSFS